MVAEWANSSGSAMRRSALRHLGARWSAGRQTARSRAMVAAWSTSTNSYAYSPRVRPRVRDQRWQREIAREQSFDFDLTIMTDYQKIERFLKPQQFMH
jgi:hypothetical protein